MVIKIKIPEYLATWLFTEFSHGSTNRDACKWICSPDESVIPLFGIMTPPLAYVAKNTQINT